MIPVGTGIFPVDAHEGPDPSDSPSVNPLCLFIGREPSLDRAFGRDMERCGVRAHRVDAVAAALDLAGQWSFDAVLLDGDSCAGPAAHALAALRDRIQVPILLLAGAADEDSQIGSLESGATDVLAKPASARLAAAKLRSLIDCGTRPRSSVAMPVAIGPLRLDPRGAQARLGAATLGLTRGEFELLFLLAANPGQLVLRSALSRALDNDAGRAVGRSLDMHVSRIRRKLAQADPLGLVLETVHGRGYALRLAVPAAPASASASASTPSLDLSLADA